MTIEEIQERLRVIRHLTDNLERDVAAYMKEAAEEAAPFAFFALLDEAMAACDPQPDITDEAGK